MQRVTVKDEVSKFMREIRRGHLPSSQQIVQEAFISLGLTRDQISSQEARANFSDYLWRIWQETLVVLERYEEQAYANGIPAALLKVSPRLVQEAAEVSRSKGI